MSKKILLVGGAGFIGSHCLDRLIVDESNIVTVLDNFKTGREWHIDRYRNHPRVTIIRGDVKDLDMLSKAMRGQSTVYHLAANADISSASSEPSVDFWEGSYLTQNVLEAMRLCGATRIVYTSGSGVYGDNGFEPVSEKTVLSLPISPYGASKLASEAMISAYVHLFAFEAIIFRLANVVGPRQTHGVAYDFVLRLLEDPRELLIYGDGTQTKSYLYIDDVIDAIVRCDGKAFNGIEVFNVSPEDSISVEEIARMVVRSLGLHDVKFNHTGGKRGWKGDIPVVCFNSNKIRETGWKNQYTSEQALQKAIDSLIQSARLGKLLAR